MRLLVYTDSVYTRDIDGNVWADRAFARFLDGVAKSIDVVIIGRLRPDPGRSRYAMSAATEFIPLPHYESLAQPSRALPAAARSLWVFWRAIAGADAVWVLGPTPLTIAVSLLAFVRRRRLFLGVRQDFPQYARSRHPRRRSFHVAADLLEATNRALARRHPIVVVGDELGRLYRSAPKRLELTVSLVSREDILDAEQALARTYDGEIRVLSVGRLDAEKNPLLMAEVLDRLRVSDSRYRLVICGEGPLESALRSRLAELGLASHAELLGYVPFDAGLLDVYRSSHVFLHASWTEGLPQVLFEAYALGLPVVATDTGGVAAAARGSALLVRPGDATAAADAVRRLATDAVLRRQLVTAGLEQARSHTCESEQARLVRFLTSDGDQA
jgi:glycosyltransferase involved in cell wall biosynthesis